MLIINVLARPGTPSSRQWPRLNSEINSSSITWFWPTITWPNWSMILRRAFEFLDGGGILGVISDGMSRFGVGVGVIELGV